jgi:hypothetical protein
MVNCCEYGDEYSSFVEGRNSQYRLSATSFSRNLGPRIDETREPTAIEIFLVVYWHDLYKMCCDFDKHSAHCMCYESSKVLWCYKYILSRLTLNVL